MFPLQNEPYTGTRRHPIRRPGILPSIASEKSGNAAPRREGPDFRFSPVRWSIFRKNRHRVFRRKCDQGRIRSAFPIKLPERALQSSGSTLTMVYEDTPDIGRTRHALLESCCTRLLASLLASLSLYYSPALCARPERCSSPARQATRRGTMCATAQSHRIARTSGEDARGATQGGTYSNVLEL